MPHQPRRAPSRLPAAVAALLRRFFTLSPPHQLEAFAEISTYLAAAGELPEADKQLEERVEALKVLGLVADELELPAGQAPAVREFDASPLARALSWNSSRIRRAFGRYSFAVAYYNGGPMRPTAAQRAAQRRARAGVFREREDYIRGLQLWLATNPASLTTSDYDAWAREHNEGLAEDELPVVTYSMLRQAFDCSWRDLLRVARGEITLDEAPPRPASAKRILRSGPDDLVGFGEIRKMLGLGLGLTAGRRRTHVLGFPPPVYRHPRGNRMRLWRRADVRAYLDGRPVSVRDGELQDEYLDAHQMAERLGFAVITVTTGSSPHVPEPDVLVGGLQLWRRESLVQRRHERL